MDKYFVSRKGLIALQQKRHNLVIQLRDCIERMGKSAAADSDLRENPEFMALRTKATYELPNTIQELEKIINNNIIIENTEEIKDGSLDFVVPGCKVTLKPLLHNMQNRTIHILGVDESQPEKNILSYQTPIAQSLLNLECFDEVEIRTGGKMIKYEIISIEISNHLEL